MLRSKLRNKFLKSISNKNRQVYKKQGNLCVSLLRQNKKDYFETLDIKEVPNSRVTKSSYETELRKMTLHFELLTRKF